MLHLSGLNGTLAFVFPPTGSYISYCYFLSQVVFLHSPLDVLCYIAIILHYLQFPTH